MNKLVEKLDAMITDMERELRRTRSARVSASHHSGFVSEKLNEIIKREANKNPKDPVSSLGVALSSVSECIEESFRHVDEIEGNIIVTINAYNTVKNEIIAHINEENQLRDQKEKAEVKNSSEKSSSTRKVRKPGTRPANKIAERKKAQKSNSKSRRKKKSTSSEETTEKES